MSKMEYKDGNNMSNAKTKILMTRGSKEQYPVLKEKRTWRYNQRQRAAEGTGLNFRYKFQIVRAHGIRKFLADNHYHLGAHGICAVCNGEAQVCTCKVIIHDLNSGEVVGEL